MLLIYTLGDEANKVYTILKSTELFEVFSSEKSICFYNNQLSGFSIAIEKMFNLIPTQADPQ